MDTAHDLSNAKVVGRYIDGHNSQTLYKDGEQRFYLQKQDSLEQLTQRDAIKWVFDSQLKNINEDTLHRYFDKSAIESFHAENETIKPRMHMSKNQDYTNKNLSWTENLNHVRNFVVERSNASEHVDKIFTKYSEQITIPEVKNIFSDYYEKSEKAWLKGKKVDLLADTMMTLYKSQSNSLTGDTKMGERFYADKGFKTAIIDEAKNLHSGTTFFSMDLATREIRTLRIENNKLKELNHNLNVALTNLAKNVRAKFGLKEKDVDQMMEKPPVELAQENNTKEVVRGTNTGKGAGLEL